MQIQETRTQTPPHYFFIGIAGTGMSALAQYMHGTGIAVSGSDRFFKPGEYNDTRSKLENLGITCFAQDGSGIHEGITRVIVSTAIEDTIPEVRKTRELGIPIQRRSELLAEITASRKTIAVGGTSGKSTTSAMIFDILLHAGQDPSIISGAGLVSLIERGLIGNAAVGKGDWLVIEADESDGSIVQYHAEVGVLLNIDKDHKEIEALKEIFTIFRDNSKLFITNSSHDLSASLSTGAGHDFTIRADGEAAYKATSFVQQGLRIQFQVNGVPFSLQTVGTHNMENALAAAATAHQLGVPLETAAEALASYKGIYRRHQVLGKKEGVWLIDDYAHNPVKCARSIEACQPLAGKVVAWLQPHGYAPTKFLRADFVQEIVSVLRPQDEIWMSEIFYAGGTTIKDISAEDLVNDIRSMGKKAFFVPDRINLLGRLRPHLDEDTVLLLMGARDPSLEAFAAHVWNEL
jgi:UDP-N-acetylmuramate--alanine ligase